MEPEMEHATAIAAVHLTAIRRAGYKGQDRKLALRIALQAPSGSDSDGKAEPKH